MTPTRTQMYQCISYISIYTPDLLCKLQGSSADSLFRFKFRSARIGCTCMPAEVQSCLIGL